MIGIPFDMLSNRLNILLFRYNKLYICDILCVAIIHSPINLYILQPRDGVEKGPDLIRAAGLVEKLKAQGDVLIVILHSFCDIG